MADLPSDAAIRSKMQVLMKTVDLETMSTKQFIGALSTAFGGVNLTSKKKHIKQWITEIIDGMEGNDAEENEEEEDEEDEEEEEEEDEEKPKKRQGGLQSAREISDELASFLNCDKYMARTAIVKALWGYIKDKNLQNPDNKKEILLDAPMKAVFGTDRFDMFSMNKYVSTHIHPFPPLDLTPSTKRKSPGDIEPKAKKKKREGVKRAPGIQAPYRLSKDLAAVCGKDILPRPQVTSALWAYIRRCNLQNPEDKRQILCDVPLKRVMGGEDIVTMFSMNKYISAHLLEKLDRSMYVHEEPSANVGDAADGEEE